MPVRTVDVSPGGFFACPRTARRFRAVPPGSAGERADGEAERLRIRLPGTVADEQPCAA